MLWDESALSASARRAFLSSIPTCSRDQSFKVEWARLQRWDGLTGAVENARFKSMRSENFELLGNWIRSDQDAGLVSHQRIECRSDTVSS